MYVGVEGVTHDSTIVMPHPLVLPDDTTNMPYPPVAAPVDAEMPQHAVVYYTYNPIKQFFS